MVSGDLVFLTMSKPALLFTLFGLLVLANWSSFLSHLPTMISLVLQNLHHLPKPRDPPTLSVRSAPPTVLIRRCASAQPPQPFEIHLPSSILLYRRQNAMGLAQYGTWALSLPASVPSSSPPRPMWAAVSMFSSAELVSVYFGLGMDNLPTSSIFKERSPPFYFSRRERSLPLSSIRGERTFPSCLLSLKGWFFSDSRPEKNSNTLTDLSSCVAVFTGPEDLL